MSLSLALGAHEKSQNQEDRALEDAGWNLSEYSDPQTTASRGESLTTRSCFRILEGFEALVMPVGYSVMLGNLRIFEPPHSDLTSLV